MLADIPKGTHIIPPSVLEPITSMKKSLGDKVTALNVHETLIAMSLCRTMDPTVDFILSKIPELSFSEAHSTKMLPANEEASYKKLKINLTCDPEFMTDDLFIQ